MSSCRSTESGRSRGWLVAVCVGLWLAAGPGAARADLRADLAATVLEPARARPVRRLNIEVGGATLRLEDGWVVPASAVEGQVREFVFLGTATFELQPPDAVEANQLEVFTDKRTVSEEVSEAVLALGGDAIMSALLAAPEQTLAPELVVQARELFTTWRESGERETLQVEQMLWIDALGDPAGSAYFAGWFDRGAEERFLFVYDPWEFEQVTLGQFVPIELTQRQERKVEKIVRKEQRKGRFIGLDIAELGVWDSWISSSPRDDQGPPMRGGLGFDAEHYRISVAVAPKSLELTAEIDLVVRATSGGRRSVPLELARDLLVDTVRSAAGVDLPFHQLDDRLVVALPDAPATGDAVTFTIEYGGRIFDERDNARVLRTPMWYPRLGEHGDHATYDVSFRWPDRFELLATGERVEGGQEGEMRWERWRLDSPASFFAFEIGRFEFHTAQAGDTGILLALDPGTRRSVRKDVSNLLEAAGDALTYFEEIFGEYPHPNLTIVTLPRSYSQAPPGFITLDRFSARQAAADEETENRYVLAHEIAHQWWGHKVGWESYRDQWLSEGLANYATLLFVRNRGEGKRLGPTQGWKRSMVRRTVDGRQVESLGPIVLGSRLNSSHSSRAYFDIVYRKGAVVMDMLARSFGEEAFIKVLSSLLRGVEGQSISTEDFFALIERITGANLEAFTDQFIYNTGLPEVYYDYEVEQEDTGTWVVRGEAVQNSPYRLEYRLIRRPNGKIDVDSEQVVQIDIERSTLVVPAQAVVYDPDRETDTEEPERTGNAVLQVHMVVQGPRTPFEFRLPHEPKQFWLDARSEVFGSFYSQRRSPKRALYYRGLELAAAERWEEAEAKLEEALAAEPFGSTAWGGRESSEDDRLEEQHETDAKIHWRLMRMQLAQGHTNSAQRASDAAEAAWREYQKVRRYASNRPSYVTVLDARLALQKGNPQLAYDTLKQRRVSSREWYLTMALAARALDKQDDYDEAIEEAEERGADVSLLTEATEATEATE